MSDDLAFIANDNDYETRIKSLGEISDDLVKPFMLEASNLRGRMVKLGGIVDTILSAHDYPDAVAHLVAETLTLSLLLSSMIKYKGIFTLQIQTRGAIKMLVADVTSEGKVRACASYDADMLANVLAAGNYSDIIEILGEGHVAFTVDQGDEMDRYQGIVALMGPTLIDCIQHYFQQSEQIATGIKIAAGKVQGKWRSAGIMIQNMPEEGGIGASLSGDEKKYAVSKFESRAENADDTQENWRRALIFLGSCTEAEFLSPDIHPNDLLQRLFNDEGVRVFEPSEIIWECRCSQERVETLLGMLSDDDRNFMDVEGSIRMKCEFCSHEYVFETQKIERIINKESDQISD